MTPAKQKELALIINKALQHIPNKSELYTPILQLAYDYVRRHEAGEFVTELTDLQLARVIDMGKDNIPALKSYVAQRKKERNVSDLTNPNTLSKEWKRLSCDDYALCLEAAKGQTDKVKLLLDQGANIHMDNGAALRLAAENGHTDTVKLLLDYGADIHSNNDAALRWAAENGHTDTVKLLLDYGADIHANNDDALRKALDGEHTTTIKLLLDHGADILVLTSKQLKAIKKLLPGSPEVDV